MKKYLFGLCLSLLASTSAIAAPNKIETENPNDIIVTARYRNEELRNTPIAITAIDSKTLDLRGNVNTGDLMGIAPNVLFNAQPSAAGTASVSIRGMSFADVEKSYDPTVAVVVDGVFIGTSTGQYLDLYDTSQLEILRGPQGTLFGRNTIGGVINIKRTRPLGRLDVKADVSYGNYNSYTAKTVVNLPKLADSISTKLWYFHSQSDGFLHRASDGKSVGGYNNENFGASFLYEPSNNFNALLTVEKQIQESNPYVSSTTKNGEYLCALIPSNQCNRNLTSDLYTVFGNTIDGNEPKTYFSAPSVTLEMNYDLDAVKLTSISSYRKSTEYQWQDFDGTSLDFSAIYRQQTFRQYSQELRAAGNINNSIDYVVGAYFYDGRYYHAMNTRFFGSWVGGSLSLPNAQVAKGGTTSYAFFSDVNANITDNLRLELGGRWTHDKKWLNQFFFYQLGDSSKNFNRFTPRVSVDYHINKDTMVYASWSQGYRSGGFSLRGLTPVSATTPFNPEIVDSFELGTKVSLFDNKLNISLAGFVAKYKGMQQITNIPGGPTGNEVVIANVASSNIKGVELELSYKPVNNLTFNGSFSALKTSYNGFVINSPNPNLAPLTDTYDLSSVDMIYAPKFMGTASVNYTLKNVNFNLAYRYVGPHDVYNSQGPGILLSSNANGTQNYKVLTMDPGVRSPALNLLDASVATSFSLNGADAKLTFWGHNLLNSRGPVHAAGNLVGLWSLAFAREPRTYGVSLGLHF